MKIAYCGLIGQGTTCLERLIKAGFEIAVVLTEPAEDNYILKKKIAVTENIMKPSMLDYMKYNRIKDVCKKNNIEYYEIPDKQTLIDLTGRLKEIAAEILVVSTFAYKLPPDILNLFKIAVNTHPSLLPKYRGSTPEVWQLINNEKYSGVTVHIINDKFDAGDIIAQIKINIEPDETGASLTSKIFEIYAPELLITALSDIQMNRYKPIPQQESEASFYRKYTMEDSFIDFEKQTAAEICSIVRAGNYYYPAHFEFNNRIIIIWSAELIAQNYECAAGEAIEISANNGLIIQTAEFAVELKLVQANTPANAPLMFGGKLLELR